MSKGVKDNKYDLICNFSNYNKQTNPNWDGTHNNFLFKIVNYNYRKIILIKNGFCI